MKLVRLIRHAQSTANAGLATTAPATIALTDEGQRQARTLAASIASTPDLIVSSAFERAMATALPTAQRFPQVPCEQWPVEEFTYLSPDRFAATTQAERKPYADCYWDQADAAMTDGPGAESFDHLLGRAATMLDQLAKHDAEDILVFSHGQFIRAVAWLIKHQQKARTPALMGEFRAMEVREPLSNCWSYQLVWGGGRWTVEYLVDSSGKERFIDAFCTQQR